ncbi:protein kinase domain-containing protein [Maioricimonas rarisocia]|nr:protein kinase [Maioricimonas rarisocia]
MLSASEVMSTDEVRAYLNRIPEGTRPENGEELARALVRDRKLTAWQAQQIYSGKGKSLVLGNYVLLDQLGQGGMGTVFKAEHRRMKRIVALKTLSDEITRTPDLLARFQREVQAAARLEHPHVVAAYDADQAGETHFLVMQYVAGDDLATLVKKKGPLPFDEAVDCIIQAARGLEYAHLKGVIHRDIKPSNLLLSRDGTVKVLDMGLARIEGDDATFSDLTGSGAVMGTVDYMAPEQAEDSHRSDTRADIYSLGCSLFFLLTGKATYPGKTMMQKLVAHREAPLPSLSEAAGVSRQADAVFRRMIAKNPDERFQSMSELIAELERVRSPAAAASPGSVISEDSRLNEFLASIEPGMSATATHRPVRQQSSRSSAAQTPTVLVGSAVLDTEPTRLTNEPEAFSLRTHSGRRGGSGGGMRNWLLWGGGFLALLLLGGIIIKITNRDGSTTTIKLPEGAGVTVEKDGKTLASVPAETESTPNYALDFDGKGSPIVVASVPTNAMSQFTLEARVAYDGSLDTQICYWAPVVQLRIQEETGKYQLIAHPSEGGQRQVFSDDAVAPRDTDHVAIVWDGAELSMYVDGVRQSQTLKIAAFREHPGGKLYVGGSYNAEKVWSGHFDGRIDELRISTTARYKLNFTPARRFEPDQQTRALYHFDDATGGLATDSSGNGYDGLVENARWVQVDDELNVIGNGAEPASAEESR